MVGNKEFLENPRIYFLIKDGYFSISQLNCQNLKVGRVDIQFIRPNQSNDTDVSEFLEKSKQTFLNRYQAALKGFCGNSEKLPSGTYSSRGDQKVHKSSFYYNEETRKIVAFNTETQDLITASTYNRKDFAMFRFTKNLGQL